MTCLIYSPCPKDSGDVEIPKDIITGSLHNAEKMALLKFLIGCIFGIYKLGRRLVTLHSPLILKEGTRTSNF